MNKNRLTFSKSSRLCSVKKIAEIFEGGIVEFCHPFKFYLSPNDNTQCKVLISVPKRNFKKAVHRNRIKRVIREALRLNGVSKLTGSHICIVYIGKETPEINSIIEKIKHVLEKAGKIGQESVDSTISPTD